MVIDFVKPATDEGYQQVKGTGNEVDVCEYRMVVGDVNNGSSDD